MQYFTKDFTEFFRDLEQNNNTQWFHANKKRYEESVKTPFAQLISDLIARMQQTGEKLDITAKDCILRVNRDIRFSADKSPYNLHCTAFISQAGRKDKSIPGCFLRLAVDEIGIMGGCYQPSTQQLTAIRTAIAKDSSKFINLLQQPSFIKKYGKLKGEQAKRLPKEWKELSEHEPLLANKQFYFSASQSAGILTQKNLLDELTEYWEAARCINHFLLNAMEKSNGL